MKAFNRKELIEIKERAKKVANDTINPLWQRAYLRLADAADHLDAMIARCSVPEEPYEDIYKTPNCEETYNHGD